MTSGFDIKTPLFVTKHTRCTISQSFCDLRHWKMDDWFPAAGPDDGCVFFATKLLWLIYQRQRAPGREVMPVYVYAHTVWLVTSIVLSNLRISQAGLKGTWYMHPHFSLSPNIWALPHALQFYILFFSTRAAGGGGAPQASYDKRRHRNCFSTRPLQAFPKKN